MKNLVSHGNITSRTGDFDEAVRADKHHKGRLNRHAAYHKRVLRNRRHIKGIKAAQDLAVEVELELDN